MNELTKRGSQHGILHFVVLVTNFVIEIGLVEDRYWRSFQKG